MLKEKREDFKKQIRREYLNDIFAKKRKEIYKQHEFHSLEDSKIQEEVNEISMLLNQQQNTNFSIEVLSQLALISTTAFGISALIKSQIAPKLLKYLLQEQYINTAQQEKVSLIYANILFLNIEDKSKMPPKQFPVTFIRIVQNSQNLQTQQNCLIAIFHLIHDYEYIRIYALNQLKITDFLYKILDQFPEPVLIIQCLNILYVLIKNSPQSYLLIFKKFVKFLTQILMNSNDVQFLKLSTFNIHQILDSFQKYSSKSQQVRMNKAQLKVAEIHQALSASIKLVINCSGITKIMTASKYIAQQDYYIKSLGILEICLKFLKIQYVQKSVLPYLKFIYIELQNKIQNQAFSEIQSQNRTNRKINVYNLKIRCNELIYGMVNCDNTEQRNIFVKSELFSILLLNLEESTDQCMRESLIFPFGILLLSRMLNNSATDIVLKEIDKFKAKINCNQKLERFLNMIQISFIKKAI